MSFPRYPKYKDSGVEWLGEVPEHWDVQRSSSMQRDASTSVEDVGSTEHRDIDGAIAIIDWTTFDDGE